MLTTDDLFSFRTLSDARMSPDGRRVAFVVGAALHGAWAEPEGSRVWVVDTMGGVARTVTQGLGRDTAPAWSPDGRLLAFLSDRAERGTPRLHLLDLGGGEARALETPPGAVKRFAWSPDGGRIAFVRTDAPDDAVDERGRYRRAESGGAGSDEPGAPVVVEEDPLYDRVWTIAVAGGEVRRATGAAAHTWELAWFADGRALALVVADEPTAAAWYFNRLARLDLDGGALTTLYAPPAPRQVARPAPSPDGAAVAIVSCTWSDPGLSGGDLWLVPARGGDGGGPRNLTAGAEFSVNTAAWLPDGRALLYDAYDGNEASIGIVRLDADGAGGPERLWRGPHSLGYGGLSLALAQPDGDRAVARAPRPPLPPAGTSPNAGEGETRPPSGHPGAAGVGASHLATVAVLRESTREPGDIWLGEVAADNVAWRRLTDLHPEAARLLTQPAANVRWTAPDGLEIGGLLFLPKGIAAPAPLVVVLHGGPTAMAGHRLMARRIEGLSPLLAARGVAALLPNYRGSNGRGVAFAEANRGDLGGGDFADIMAGVDHLVAAGVADPGRLGIIGWSYGGFMAMWAVTQTDRFKAAVAGAGLADWLSFHGGSILHTWDRLFQDADPYDRAGRYTGRSPVTHIANVTTPTLILHGDADLDVPPDQSRLFFRALKDRGVETQLVLYPGAAHAPHDPRHIRDIYERSLAWFADRL